MTNTKELTAYLLAFIHGLKESGLKEILFKEKVLLLQISKEKYIKKLQDIIYLH